MMEKGVEIMNDAAPETAPHPQRWKMLRITSTMSFLASLDTSIVNIALPGMSTTMNEPASSVTWIVTSYLIAICALMLFFGRLGDIKGNTKVYKSGVIIFTAGSLLCGISINLPTLVIARIVQAVGAASVMANNQGIIIQNFHANERGRAIGFNATCVALGTMLGPPLGGFIISTLSWHFIFLVNVPIGVVIYILCRRMLPKGVAVNESLDIKGALLFGLGAVLIFCAIGGGENVNFVNPFVISAILVGLVLMVVFILVERGQKHPMLDLSIFKNSLFTISVASALMVYASISSINIIQPFYLQKARGLTSFASGLILMTYPLVLAIASPFAGYLSDKIGQKIPTLVGLCISTTGYICAAFMTVNSSLVFSGLVYGLLGIGNALFQSPNTSLIMSSAPRNKVGVAGSINSLARNVGFIFGVLLSTSILFNAMSARYGRHVNDYIQGRPDLFVYGMRITYLVIAGVCFAGALLTAFRQFSLGKRTSF